MYPQRTPTNEGGFSYLALLIAIAIIGAMAAGAVSAGAAMQRRAAEEELLFIGMQFQRAFQSYRNATSPGQPPFPERLEELERDKRGATVKRHLRKVYFDPLSGRRDWGVIDAPGGRIAGVFSKVEGQPIKTTGFPTELIGLEGKTRYSDWAFGNLPIQPVPPGAAAAGTSQPTPAY